MNGVSSRKKYAGWQKAVLIGCVLIAVLGTLGVIGGLVKVSATLSDYGGSFSVPLLVAFALMLLSVWLFAGLGAMVVYIAKTSNEIKEALAQ
ncbi:MAG TPA: hypothetical protein VIK02_07140 [Candidatus Anoxymicrobiaceae bacterium]|jgi:amino acid transporter